VAAKTILVKQGRGGYKRVPLKGFDKGNFERGRKTLWGKRRRIWTPKKKPETKVVRYTKTFIFDEGKKGRTPQTLVDAIIEDEESINMTDAEIAKKGKSKMMGNRMTKLIENLFKDEKQTKIPWRYRYIDFKESKTHGGVEAIRDKLEGSFVDSFRAWNG
jgi:hypothetical protein